MSSRFVRRNLASSVNLYDPIYCETMHSPRPLKGYDGALDRLDQRDGEDEGEGRPDDALPQERDVEEVIDLYHRRHEDMAEQQDHDIGREIIGLMPVQRLAAKRAAIRRLQEGSEQPAFTAGRASAA